MLLDLWSVLWSDLIFFGKVKVATCLNEEKEEIFEQLSISAVLLWEKSMKTIATLCLL